MGLTLEGVDALGAAAPTIGGRATGPSAGDAHVDETADASGTGSWA